MQCAQDAYMHTHPYPHPRSPLLCMCMQPHAALIVMAHYLRTNYSPSTLVCVCSVYMHMYVQVYMCRYIGQPMTRLHVDQSYTIITQHIMMVKPWSNHLRVDPTVAGYPYRCTWCCCCCDDTPHWSMVSGTMVRPSGTACWCDMDHRGT